MEIQPIFASKANILILYLNSNSNFLSSIGLLKKYLFELIFLHINYFYNNTF